MRGPFGADACSEPLGCNSFCRAIWSAIDSCLAHDWAGRRVYCNTPFAALRDILHHFWACLRHRPIDHGGHLRAPNLGRGTVVALHGRHTGRRVRTPSPHSPDFSTSSEWRDASLTNHVPARRVYRGAPPHWGSCWFIRPPVGPIDSLSG